MLKKTALTLLFIILCIAMSFAQMSPDTYNKLLSYCNCKYGAVYLKYHDAHQDLQKKLVDCKIGDNLSDLESELARTYYPASKYKNKRLYENLPDSLLVDNLFFGNTTTLDCKENLLAINSTLKDTIVNYLKNLRLLLRVDASQKPIQKIIFTSKDTIISQGNSIELKYTIEPSDADKNEKLEWESDNLAVGTVKDGKVTALKFEGEKKSITVTVKNDAGKKLGTVIIHVQKSSSPHGFVFLQRHLNVLLWSIIFFILLIILLFFVPSKTTKKVLSKIWDMLKFLFKWTLKILKWILQNIIKWILQPVIKSINILLKEPNIKRTYSKTDATALQKKHNLLKDNYATLEKERDELKEKNILLQRQIGALKKEQQQTVNNSITLNAEECQYIFKWIINNNENCDQFSRYIVNNEQLCSLWIKSALKFPDVKNIIEEKTQPKETVKTVDTVSTLYADSIIDGFFNRVTGKPNEDTVFELSLSPRNAQEATFTIFSPAKQRIVANSSFVEGCDKQALRNAQNVKVENEGTVERQTDGRWRIVKKLNVTIY